jgi:hypothetical protein
MGGGCPLCGGVPAVGVLCTKCAEPIAPAEGLLPEHVATDALKGNAWFIDGFGTPHAVRSGTVIGRKEPAELLVLHASVSREHAEITAHTEGWRIRDLGSRNATHVDNVKLPGRGALPDGAIVRIGQVGFRFVGRDVAMPTIAPGSLATAQAGGTAVRYIARGGESVELCLLTSATVEAGDGAGGALLYRTDPKGQWSELSLPPLEFQLLRALCARAVAEADSPARARGCVPTKELARDLPFQSRYANEENVRQVVRRARATLAGVGAGELIAAVPGRGYYLDWKVEKG